MAFIYLHQKAMILTAAVVRGSLYQQPYNTESDSCVPVMLLNYSTARRRKKVLPSSFKLYNLTLRYQSHYCNY